MNTEDAKALAALLEAAGKGHLTIMKFTTNWRVCFGTPQDRDEIQKMPVGTTLAEAALRCLVEAAKANKTD